MSHPYMANSAPALREELLEAVGVDDVEELFTQIPADHRVAHEPRFPRQLASEAELARHMRDRLALNQDCERNLSFLGGGVWQHHVPAVCDEIAGRTEFVTSEWGTPASDLGRNQAWFEFASQLGELLELDFVGLPVYSWGCAAGHAVRMAARITGRKRILVPANLDRERLAVVRTYCEPPEGKGHIEMVLVDTDPATGRLDLTHLDALGDDTIAAVYIETPGSLGVIEADVVEIAHRAHADGAVVIAGVDPLSLGVLAPPGAWGSDIAVGPTQPLGVHMNCGGGVGGFLASRDDATYAREFPTLQVSLAPTTRPGERGFAMALFEQSSYGKREGGNDWTGNSVYLWAIVNAAYMALLGPTGFEELGRTILQRSHYAARLMRSIKGVDVRWGGCFKEFVVSFEGTGHTVAHVNAALRQRGIFGGADLSQSHPELGQSALYCVTEIHTQEDIERLAAALTEVTR